MMPEVVLAKSRMLFTESIVAANVTDSIDGIPNKVEKDEPTVNVGTKVTVDPGLLPA